MAEPKANSSLKGTNQGLLAEGPFFGSVPGAVPAIADDRVLMAEGYSEPLGRASARPLELLTRPGLNYQRHVYTRCILQGPREAPCTSRPGAETSSPQPPSSCTEQERKRGQHLLYRPLVESQDDEVPPQPSPLDPCGGQGRQCNQKRLCAQDFRMESTTV